MKQEGPLGQDETLGRGMYLYSGKENRSESLKENPEKCLKGQRRRVPGALWSHWNWKLGCHCFPFERVDSDRAKFGGLKKEDTKGNQGQSTEYESKEGLGRYWMTVSGRSKIEEWLVSIKILDYLFRSMKRWPETETVEEERKTDVGCPGGESEAGWKGESRLGRRK